ncbi:hypothetical protein BC831DRAFT_481985 [Entophlyctis helioformis]|nr:hypothetical protein BC831DRAFT_481985 [Entophlyctis helioformis]
MDLFNEDPQLRMDKPLFDCMHEYVALTVAVASIIVNLGSVAFYSKKLWIVKTRTVFLQLMLSVSILLFVAQVSFVIARHVNFSWTMEAIYHWTLASGSMVFAVAQVLAMEVFLPRHLNVSQFTRKIIVAHFVIHLATATPMYFYGVLFVDWSDTVFMARWCAATIALWWFWMIVYDLWQSLYIGRVIVKICTQAIELRISDVNGDISVATATPTTDAAPSSANLPRSLSILRHAPAGGAAPQTVAQPPAEKQMPTLVSCDQLSSLTASHGAGEAEARLSTASAYVAASAAGSGLAASPSFIQPGIPRLPSSKFSISAHMSSFSSSLKGMLPRQSTVVPRMHGAPQTRQTTILREFRGQFNKTITVLVLYALLDCIGMVLFLTSNDKSNPAGSLQRRKANALMHIASTFPSFHAAAATLFYTNLSRLFSVSRACATDNI